jgi:ubiquitin-protein ligase E3 C
VTKISMGVMLTVESSRRPFLPKDHWLMTKQVKMSGFIEAVALEEQEHLLAQQIQEEQQEEESSEDDEEYRFSRVGNNRTQRAWHRERLIRKQERLQKKRYLEAVTPRLEILQNMPFFIPFHTRVEVFRQFVLQDMARRRGDKSIDPDMWRMSLAHQGSFAMDGMQHARDIISRQHAQVKRESIFEDAFKHYYGIGDQLKEPIQITFVDQFGTVEAGIDGGGVTKEFLTSITKEAFGGENSLSLFITNDQNLLYPNPAILDEHEDILRATAYTRDSPEWKEHIRNILQRYEFLGRIIGKCIYEGILVDVSFAGFFLLKWALTSAAGETSYRSNINDLRDLDQELYEGLVS